MDFSQIGSGPTTRRQFFKRAALLGGAVLLPSGCSDRSGRPVVEDQPVDGLAQFPGKVPMRVVNDRPPCLETPWSYYSHDLTPNDAFYVRWHLQVLPTRIDLRTWRLRIDGNVEKPLELSLDDLKKMEPVSVVAVNQCSGNSRSFFEPPIPGSQWGNGAMGNARWTGVRLKDLLDKAGLKEGTVQVAFQGLDRGGLPSVHDFIKSLPVDEAQRPEILVAWNMNDQPLPMLNGFPVRLVVAGWYATYWVKALSHINVLTKPWEGFWMKPAYRIPTTPGANEKPTALAEVTIPINRMNVRSFFTSAPGVYPLSGIAFDGGSGIAKVEVSPDDGKTWEEAKLGKDLGPYSFRRWTLDMKPGAQRLMVRATSIKGETQPLTPGWNRSGYMRNVVETLDMDAKSKTSR